MTQFFRRGILVAAGGGLLLLVGCTAQGAGPGGGDSDLPAGDTVPVACATCADGEQRCSDQIIERCIWSAEEQCWFWGLAQVCSLEQVCLGGTCLPGSCNPGDSVPCTEPCRTGQRGCENGSWTECVWDPSSMVEICDGLDNDCNDLVDDIDPARLGFCGNQQGVCAGSREICLGEEGPYCGPSVFSEHAAANGAVYQTEESLCDGEDNDCDGELDESRASDPNGCGRCDRSCSPGQPCVDGACGCAGAGDCEVDETCDPETDICACAAGSHRCDGLCVADDDPAHCGDRCLPCPEPGEAESSCDGSSCGLVCGPGLVSCGGFCVTAGGCDTCMPCAPDRLEAAPAESSVVVSWPDRSVAALGPLPESEHPYASSTIDTQTYRLPGATRLTLRFAVETELEDGWDWLQIFDHRGREVPGSPFTGSELAGAEVTVPGDTVRVRLDTGLWGNRWGYRVEQLVDASGAGAVESYRLYWRTSPGVGTGDESIANVRSPFVHDGLDNGTPYHYAVSAMGSVGEGGLSEEANATPAAGIPVYAVSGQVTGLIGTGLQLRLNHGETLTLDADAEFEFSTGVSDGAAFAVTIPSDPVAPAQRCVVINGAGVIAGADVIDLEVVCSLQIATFNLYWFDSDDSVTKKQGIADIILDNGIDLIGVQEVRSGVDLGVWVADYLGAESWGYVMGTSGGSLRVGFVYRRAVLAINEGGELNWSRSGGVINQNNYPWDGYNRLPYWARLVVPQNTTTFEIAVLHLKASGDSASCARRRDQVDNLTAWIDSIAPATLLTIGDFNDRLSGDGMCGASEIDTMASFENHTDLVFATEQPTYMSSTLSTFIGSSSVLDHIMINRATLGRLFAVDADGHLASVVTHGDETISDHQPPYVWLALE